MTGFKSFMCGHLLTEDGKKWRCGRVPRHAGDHIEKPKKAGSKRWAPKGAR